ncbi:MAG: hypothetical protein AAFR64_13805, partial [Pseudomonadota bacterium]
SLPGQRVVDSVTQVTSVQSLNRVPAQDGHFKLQQSIGIMLQIKGKSGGKGEGHVSTNAATFCGSVQSKNSRDFTTK